MSVNEKANIGVAWWRREQWDRLREVSVDGHKLDDTYDDWLAHAENLLKADHGGVSAEKVDVDVEKLLEWCNEEGLPVNGASRARYVAKVLRDRDQTP